MAREAERSGELLVSRAGATLRLTINRESRRNALSGAVLTGMRDALGELDDAVRAVLIDSVGEQVFCSGADLVAMAPGATGWELHASRGLLREVVLALRAAPVPVVARVQGLCLAGGVGLVLGADIVLASAAAQFGLPEVNLGLWPFMVSALLSRHCSPKQAMDLMCSGRRIPAASAEAMGLVSRVLAPGDLDAAVAELLQDIAGKPPLALRLGKAALHAVERPGLAEALSAMQAQLSLLTQTSDAAEGVAAFLAKRAPNYTGR